MRLRISVVFVLSDSVKPSRGPRTVTSVAGSSIERLSPPLVLMFKAKKHDQLTKSCHLKPIDERDHPNCI